MPPFSPKEKKKIEKRIEPHNQIINDFLIGCTHLAGDGSHICNHGWLIKHNKMLEEYGLILIEISKKGKWNSLPSKISIAMENRKANVPVFASREMSGFLKIHMRFNCFKALCWSENFSTIQKAKKLLKA